MNNRILISVLLFFFVAAALFFVDFILANLIGIVANMFNASAFFYSHVYPIIVALIISASIAFPLTAILLRRFKNFGTRILKHEGNTVENYKMSA